MHNTINNSPSEDLFIEYIVPLIYYFVSCDNGWFSFISFRNNIENGIQIKPWKFDVDDDILIKLKNSLVNLIDEKLNENFDLEEKKDIDLRNLIKDIKNDFYP